MSLSLFVLSCSSLNYIKRTVYDANTGKSIVIEVPENCDDYSDGLIASINAIVKYGQQEASFKADLNKINIIEQYSSRIKTITTAQCKINQNAVTIDTRISDQVFFMDLIKNYTEYQKIKDILDSDTSSIQKDKIANALLEVYNSIYINKKDDLLAKLSDMMIRITALEGSIVEVYINNQCIAASTSGIDGDAIVIINKKYLLEKPNERTSVLIKINKAGYMTTTMEYTISELYKFRI